MASWPGETEASMTEAEWLACDDIWTIFNQAHGRDLERLLRLLLAACCRLLWRAYWSAGWRDALDAAERFADGAASPEEMKAVRRNIHYLNPDSPGRLGCF
jgi:hypothetical protein